VIVNLCARVVPALQSDESTSPFTTLLNLMCNGTATALEAYLQANLELAAQGHRLRGVLGRAVQ
jgi:hypothetical protein